MFEAIFAGGILLLAVIGGSIAPTKDPYSCRQYYEAQHNCAFGNCDARVQERLKRECLRDGGQP
jgi:hypothetical protein